MGVPDWLCAVVASVSVEDAVGSEETAESVEAVAFSAGTVESVRAVVDLFGATDVSGADCVLSD